MRIGTGALWWLLTLPPAAFAGWYIGRGAHGVVRGPLPNDDLGADCELVPPFLQLEPTPYASSKNGSGTAIGALLSRDDSSAQASATGSSGLGGGGAVRFGAPAGLPSESSRVLPLDLDDGMLPTPHGLYSMTTDLWSQSEFLEAVGLDVRDLPTLGDCERALDDEEAKALLVRAQVAAILLGEMSRVPWLLRTERFYVALDVAVRGAAEVERELMAHLEGSRSNSYSRWAEVHALYQEWAR